MKFGEIALEAKLSRLLTLSWHVRGQIRAKCGKLMLLGGLRGAKFDLKGALEAAQEAPKGLQRSKIDIDPAADGRILGPRAPPKVT